MNSNDAQWTPDKDSQLQHVLDWIGNDAIAASIRDSLGIYQDIDHTIDLLSSNEDLINALKNQKGTFNIKNTKECNIIKNHLTFIPAFIVHIFDMNNIQFYHPTSPIHNDHTDVPYTHYSIRDFDAFVQDMDSEVVDTVVGRKSIVWNTIFSDVFHHGDELSNGILVMDSDTDTIYGSVQQDGTCVRLWGDIEDELPTGNLDIGGEKVKDNDTFVLGIDTNTNDGVVHQGGTGGRLPGYVETILDNNVEEKGDFKSMEDHTATTVTNAVDHQMAKSGDIDHVFLYKTVRSNDKKIRRSISQLLMGTSRNYEGASQIATPYAITIQKYVRRFLSTSKFAKMKGMRHHRQVTFAKHPVCIIRIPKEEWGGTTDFLKRRHERMTCTIPHHVTHDWQLIDLLVRGFTDKMGHNKPDFWYTHSMFTSPDASTPDYIHPRGALLNEIHEYTSSCWYHPFLLIATSWEIVFDQRPARTTRPTDTEWGAKEKEWDAVAVLLIHELIVVFNWTLTGLRSYLGCILDLDNPSYPSSSISSMHHEIHSLQHRAMTFGTEDGEIVDELVVLVMKLIVRSMQPIVKFDLSIMNMRGRGASTNNLFRVWGAFVSYCDDLLDLSSVVVVKPECRAICSNNLTKHVKVNAGIDTPINDNGLCGAEVMLNIHGSDEMLRFLELTKVGVVTRTSTLLLFDVHNDDNGWNNNEEPNLTTRDDDTNANSCPRYHDMRIYTIKIGALEHREPISTVTSNNYLYEPSDRSLNNDMDRTCIGYMNQQGDTPINIRPVPIENVLDIINVFIENYLTLCADIDTSTYHNNTTNIIVMNTTNIMPSTTTYVNCITAIRRSNPITNACNDGSIISSSSSIGGIIDTRDMNNGITPDVMCSTIGAPIRYDISVRLEYIGINVWDANNGHGNWQYTTLGNIHSASITNASSISNTLIENCLGNEIGNLVTSNAPSSILNNSIDATVTIVITCMANDGQQIGDHLTCSDTLRWNTGSIYCDNNGRIITVPIQQDTNYTGVILDNNGTSSCGGTLTIRMDGIDHNNINIIAEVEDTSAVECGYTADNSLISMLYTRSRNNNHCDILSSMHFIIPYASYTIDYVDFNVLDRVRSRSFEQLSFAEHDHSRISTHIVRYIGTIINADWILQLYEQSNDDNAFNDEWGIHNATCTINAHPTDGQTISILPYMGPTVNRVSLRNVMTLHTPCNNIYDNNVLGTSIVSNEGYMVVQLHMRNRELKSTGYKSVHEIELMICYSYTIWITL